MEYFSAVLSVITIALLLVFLFKKGKSGMSANNDTLEKKVDYLTARLADEFERNRRESGASQKEMREETTETLRFIAEKLSEMIKTNYEYQERLRETLNHSLNIIRSNNIEQNDRQTKIVSEAIARMQESNEKKLDQMRATVDEKLNSTLATRLDSSFKSVSDQLQNVYNSLGEMRNLSQGITTNVTSLNRVLTNVKTRGTWAEVQLGNILDQTIPNMYERNFAPAGGSEIVEFAVRIPSGEEGGKTTFLPIDSKFPMEDYVRLCDAADNADAQGVEAARKALESKILFESRKISKYINVPVTTPFAIMYLATEGLYAEIASSRSGLPERLQSECNVMIAGPTTITALLNSLALGFRAVAVNEKANEIRLLLAAAKVQYDKFGFVLEKAKRKIEDAGRSLDEAQDRNRIIQKNLKGIDEISSAAGDEILGISGGAEQQY